jgi:hypothetical protein
LLPEPMQEIFAFFLAVSTAFLQEALADPLLAFF